ncbi:MAG: hypothetical protein J7L40_02465 [Candidatus Marinimicrobia bacterium]|nr:hypothetical protein [Candidatus Neomarinimicrobiota bacterium]
MLTIKLAFKNLVGAGRRAWLNIIVLSIVYVMIIIMVGINYGEFAEDMGMNMGSIIYPEFSFSLILSLTLMVAAIIMLVSYLPAQSISKLNPTQVLKGK